MRSKLLKATIVASIFGLWLPVGAKAQAKTPIPGTAKSTPAKAKTSKTSTKLQDFTLVSTTAAAREAAKEARNKAAGKSASKSGQAENTAVVELQPAALPSSADSDSGSAKTKAGKKPLLKDFHGSLYGTAGAQGVAGKSTAGEIGTGSSNGKVNIFVEGQHTQATTPAPH